MVKSAVLPGITWTLATTPRRNFMGALPTWGEPRPTSRRTGYVAILGMDAGEYSKSKSCKANAPAPRTAAPTNTGPVIFSGGLPRGTPAKTRLSHGAARVRRLMGRALLLLASGSAGDRRRSHRPR